ncbi:hypothetical protein GGX14DRAFT_485506, partial [Mycena pura]
MAPRGRAARHAQHHRERDVVRPGSMYGRSASLLAMLSKGASQGRVTWPGTPGGHYPIVHTD